MCLCACSLNNPYSSLPTIGEHAVSQTCRERVWPYLLDCICWNLMKSTKVQNPRCIPRIKPIIRAYWPPIALRVLPGQYSLLRRLAASCIVWDKAEPAIYSNNPPRCAERPGGVRRFQRSRTQSTAGGLGPETIRMRTTYN